MGDRETVPLDCIRNIIAFVKEGIEGKMASRRKEVGGMIVFLFIQTDKAG